MKMPPKELLETDMDDTLLLGPKPVYIESIDEAIRPTGVELSREIVEERANEYWGSSFKLVVRNVVRDQNLPPKVLREIDCRFIEIAREGFKKHVIVVSGVVDILHELKSAHGYKLGITTAAPREIVDSGVISDIGLPLELFDQIVCVDDEDVAGRAKPDPYTLQKIMHDQQVAPLNTVMLGDAPCDAEAARRAGVDFIGVKTGLFGEMSSEFLKAERRRLCVKFLVANAAQIKPVLEKLEQARSSYYHFTDPQEFQA